MNKACCCALSLLLELCLCRTEISRNRVKKNIREREMMGGVDEIREATKER